MSTSLFSPVNLVIVTIRNGNRKSYRLAYRDGGTPIPTGPVYGTKQEAERSLVARQCQGNQGHQGD